MHYQRVGCTPRGSVSVPVFPPLLHGRRGTICTVTGSDARPRDSAGVPGSPPLLRRRHGPCIASMGLASQAWALHRRHGPCIAGMGLASQAWASVRYQRVGYRPRVPLASLGLRFFCMAGVG